MLIMVSDEVGHRLLKEGLLEATKVGVLLATRGELKLKALVEPTLDNTLKLAAECGIQMKISFGGHEDLRWKIYSRRRVSKFGEATTIVDLREQMVEGLKEESKEFALRYALLHANAQTR